MPSKEAPKAPAVNALAEAVRATNPDISQAKVVPEGRSKALADLEAHVQEMEKKHGPSAPETEEARRLANIVRYVK